MTLLYKCSEGVGRMTFDFPAKKNALDQAARKEMERIVTEVRDDDRVRALLIAGTGGAFCAGGDINTFAGASPTAMRDRMKQQHRVTRMLYDLEKPVIAAVAGPAFGVGFNIALLADVILAAPSAQFCQAYARVAIVPDGGGLYLLSRVVGTQRAKAMFMTAQVIGAQEARDLGIVHAIHDEDALEAEAIALATRLADGPTRAFGLGKAMLNRGMDCDFATYLEIEATAEAFIMQTEDHREAVAAFREKRKPCFSGT
ncbi:MULTISPECIES: enoyl-CoA hydratase/isomerase family protein [Paracoccaceae]|uniref:enoyl-CoA hydratase/isomerase family protein n=1 Tax=Paracoccaceae TaxID=31989 RepID=UPI000B0FC8CD|nr:enoyl-CoA hydratase-related protein [Marinibacterium profundimaris]